MMHCLAIEIPSEFSQMALPTEWTIPPHMWWHLFIGGCAVVVAVAVIHRGRRLWVTSASTRLFGRIAGELGLSLSDKWLLWRIARGTGLASPISLLVSGATLEHHARQWGSELNLAAAGRLEHRVGLIRRRLFE